MDVLVIESKVKMENVFRTSFPPNVSQGVVTVAELIQQLSQHLANVTDLIRQFMEEMAKLAAGCCRKSVDGEDEVDGVQSPV